MSAIVSACVGKLREPLRDAVAVRARPSQADAEHGDRVVELVPRHRLRCAAVAQAARLLAGKIERVCDAGKTPRIRQAARLRHSRHALASAIRCPARLPLSTEETYCGSSGRRSRVSYQL